MMKNFRLSNNLNEYGKQMCSFDDLLQIIQFDKTTQKVCEALRSGNLDEARERQLKEMLKTVEFNSITETHRRKENIKEFTGYVCIDLDDTGVDYDKLREDLAADTTLNPVLMFASPRGKLKLVLHLSQMHGATEEEFYDYYKQCVIYIAEKYGVVADTNCMNPVCLCFVSHDDNPYYNPEEPLCKIPFYPVGSEEVATTYGYYANDKKNGIKTHNGGGYNDDMYSEWLRTVKDDLVTVDGDYDYDRNREKVFIGSVSGGTAVDHGVGFMGYALKFRLSVCTMWLYNNNTAKAQRLIENCFADANDKAHPWNRCCSSHSRFKPEKDVLLWFLKTFGFKSMYELPKTTFEFAQEIRADFSQRDATIAEKWDAISREYQMPEILNLVMADETASNESKDVMLYSALATMSGFARNTYVRYNKGDSGLNLTLNVIGSSASGKGYMAKQANLMLRSLDGFAQDLNARNYNNYKKELNEWKKWNAAKTSVDYGEGEPFPNGEPEPPTVVINQTNLATSNAWASILKQNNEKMVLVNTEYSNLIKMENGKYGGLLSQMKNIFDNDPVGNLSATALAEGKIDTVQHPNCGVLLSGTFGQFRQLYKSFEDGLLTRSIYYIVPDKEFNLVPLFGSNQQERENKIEKMFIGWYLSNHYGRKVSLVLPDADFEKLRVEMNKFVNEVSKDYDLGDEVGSACASMFRRFPHIVFKVAALLQTLKGFEEDGWDENDDRTPEEMLWKQVTYWRSQKDNILRVDGEYTADDYLKAQNNDYSFIADEDEREIREDPYPLYVRLNYNWVEAAWKLLMPSLVYGLRMLGTYRKEDTAMGNVNPLKGQAKYMALELCEEEFRYADYKKMLDLIRKKDTNDKTVAQYLKQLTTENFVEKDSSKNYKKRGK